MLRSVIVFDDEVYRFSLIKSGDIDCIISLQRVNELKK